MRGDSIRDFYAKTLALLGLGVLAGTGALVDYWPVSSVTLPAATTALTLPDVAESLPVPDAPSAPVLTAAARPPLASRPVPVLSVRASLTSVAVGEAARLVAPPPASFDVAPLYSARGYEITFHEPSAGLQPIATFARLSESPAVGGDEDRDGFLSGAVKRTGTSIARTGAKTGSSIWDALRAVPAAVRKALPN